MSESSGAAGPVTGSSSGAGMSIGIAMGSGAGGSGGAGGGKGSGASATGGGVKTAGVSLVATGGVGSLGPGVASGAGKSAGIGGGAARTGVSAGTASEKSTSGAGTGDKTAGVSSDKASSGMLPESVVSPLIGAGANVYIMTNELTQSMREKLGTSWPFVQDTLNSRYAKLLAGGLLASVAFIVVWKIIKRFSAKVKRPPESEDEEAYQWNTAKTYELTPVSEGKRQQGPRSEGDGYTLPAKIQMRIADSTLQGSRPAAPEICKARDPATRHRHTRHLLQGQGERSAADTHSQWHSEQPGNHYDDLHCSCPSDLYGSLPPQPRLLYSVNESHSERRAVNMPHAHLQDLLTYASSTPTLCPAAALGSACPHAAGSPKPCCLYPHAACTPHVNLAPARVSEGASWLATHQHPMFHSHQAAAVNLMNPYQVQSYLSHQHGNLQSPFRPGFNAGINYISVPYSDGLKTDIPWPCSFSTEKAQTMTSASSVIETAGRQTSVPDVYSSSQTVESKARSVSQQTDGQPVDEDLDMPAHLIRDNTTTFQVDHNQKVPTRTAQSHVTPSQCTNTPLRTDHSQLHVHSSLTCPSHLSSVPQTIVPTVYQTPQGTVVQLSASGECPVPYPALHHNSSMHFHSQHPAILDTFGVRALPAPSLLQPLPYVSSAQQQSLGPQRQTAKLRQQPVVQHPSDSSVSQNSSEPNTIQDSRQYEGSHPTTGSQETTGPEELSQEPYNRIGAGAPVFLPRGNQLASGLRTLTDFSQSDHPWLRAQGVPGYQPTPVCVLGYQSSNARPFSPQHSSAWSAPSSVFMTPSPNLLVSSPAGMVVTSSPQLVQSTASPWQAPYLYPQTHFTMSRQAGFNPNFNLSNSNPQFFMQEAGQTTMPVLPLSQEPGKITVIGSDHSINSNNAAAAAVKTSVTAVSMSEVSLSTVATETPEVMSRTCQVSSPAPAYNVQNLQSGDALVTELAATDEKSHLTLSSAAAAENPDHFQHTEAKTELCSVFQTDSHVPGHTEVTQSPSGSLAGSTSIETMETQI